ncbi:MAG: PHP domain-containing protein [Acidimicrobiia bacterium]|nr:PHP domain-containing protein [Acidimicrobiia bacterium]
MIDPRFVARDPDPGVAPRPGWVRMDFHMHTFASGDAVTQIDEFCDAVERSRLDVVCVTDHHAVRVAWEIEAALANVRVVVGEEIKTHAGELIGLFLTEKVPYGLPAAECARRIRDQGAITYVPHPVGPRNHAMAPAAMEALLDAGLLDAVEVFNARNAFDAANEAAAAFATEHSLPGGAGSDAHYPEEIGTAWLELPDFDGPAGLLDAMGHGVVHGRRRTGGAWRPRIIPSSSPAAADDA